MENNKLNPTFLFSKETLSIELRSYNNKLVYRLKCPVTDVKSINSAIELLKSKYNLNLDKINYKVDDEDWFV